MSGVHGHKKVFQLWIKVENNYAKCRVTIGIYVHE